MDSLIFAVALIGLLFLSLPIALIVVYVVLRNRNQQLQAQVDRLREQLGTLRHHFETLAETRTAPPLRVLCVGPARTRRSLGAQAKRAVQSAAGDGIDGLVLLLDERDF